MIKGVKVYSFDEVSPIRLEVVDICCVIWIRQTTVSGSRKVM